MEIEAFKLTKKYKELTAVDSLDLSVGKEIYGFLGPNGSGKTTTVSMLTTLLRPTSGEARICGVDVRTQPQKVREHISYVPQYMAVDIRLTGRENIDLYARLYGIRDKTERKRRVEEALDIMKLTDRADDPTATYSGGMQRRLELGQALTHYPDVLFLDEPTMGLDVASRRSVWEYISVLREKGMAIFVTTHQMEEAERYCDKVGIVSKGILMKEGSPAELTGSMGPIIRIRSANGCIPKKLPDEVKHLMDDRGTAVFLGKNTDSLYEIMSRYSDERIDIVSSAISDPTLEDVYLSVVGNSSVDSGTFSKVALRNMIRSG